jgi:hypothetical protein
MHACLSQVKESDSKNNTVAVQNKHHIPFINEIEWWIDTVLIGK